MNLSFPKPLRRARLTAVAALVAAAACGASAPSAEAGIATIYQCRTPTGPADTDLMSTSGSGAMTVSLLQCATAPVSILSTGGSGGIPSGTRDLHFTAPGDTVFAGGEIHRQMSGYAFIDTTDNSADSWAFGAQLTTAGGDLIEHCGLMNGWAVLGSCAPAFGVTAPGGYTTFPAPSVTLPSARTSGYKLAVGCALDGYCKQAHLNPGVRDIRARLLVADDNAPVDVVAGGPIAGAGTIGPGDAEVTVSAKDPGGLGIHRVQIAVDGVVTGGGTPSTNGGRCTDADATNNDPYEFTSGQPCPRVISNVTYRPALPEGVHTVTVSVLDAAGNATEALSRRVTVDQIPAPVSTAPPVVRGTAREGRTLVAEPGGWNTHGAAVTATNHQWQRCPAAGTDCADIPGATGSSHDLTAADAGARVRVLVRLSTSEGTTTAPSWTTDVVAGAAAAGAQAARTGAGDGTLGPDTRPVGSANGTGATPAAQLTASANGRSALRVRYGRSVTVSGTLRTPAGKAITGARLEVGEREQRSGASWRERGQVITDAQGRFRYVMAKGPSRAIRVAYRASVGDAAADRTASVQVRVIASVRLGVSSRNLRNGQTLRYSGRIAGARTGHRFVEVLVRRGRGWQVVCSVRTDSRGSFACAHRFSRTLTATTYVFRARVRKQAGLPYDGASSPRRSVRVRP